MTKLIRSVALIQNNESNCTSMKLIAFFHAKCIALPTTALAFSAFIFCTIITFHYKHGNSESKYI